MMIMYLPEYKRKRYIFLKMIGNISKRLKYFTVLNSNMIQNQIENNVDQAGKYRENAKMIN